MVHLLVLAEDECIRLTCAEVLTRLGFAATAGGWPPRSEGGIPDAILLWEATKAAVSETRAAYGEVPLLVCTWRHREPWHESVGIVQLPFNAERVARIVERTLREVRERPAQTSR
jgi:hypothetical protein